MIDVGNLVRASDAGIVVITEVQPISVLFTLPQQDLPDINRAVRQARAQGRGAGDRLQERARHGRA